MTETAWEAEFAKYRLTPEYKLLNHGMTLAEYKFIFFWEYIHRLLGRFIGVVFLIPGLMFWRRGWIDRALGAKLFIGFVLGGLQGALGWYMVKSGLVNNPHVSHFRLAAHLLLAFGVVSYLMWILLSMSKANETKQALTAAEISIRRALGVITAVLLVQILYGAFTAGLHAGYGFNTFPKMNDEWFPSGFFRADILPTWLNTVENPIAVQFIHRWTGTVLVAAVLALGWAVRRLTLAPFRARAIRDLVIGTVVQFVLGVATLLMVVPISLGTLHQLGACLLLLLAVRALHAFRVTG